ncbi:hypothetical protein CEXT_483211 [Caerostris extrusa]|uniref:Secreted protein n=1 Tax=Caerostris extrusa TaxID=172846 RepID=A0AAV4Y5C9_CAEEX|nr:hypothetical protein CEXT_483211 [Caerostris extrusa]
MDATAKLFFCLRSSPPPLLPPSLSDSFLFGARNAPMGCIGRWSHLPSRMERGGQGRSLWASSKDHQGKCVPNPSLSRNAGCSA